MLSFWAANGRAQTNKPVLHSVDTAKQIPLAQGWYEQPKFEGADAALFKFIKDNLKVTKSMIQNSHEGNIFVGFTVKINGELTGIEVKRGLSKELDEEAIRVVKLTSGKWKPGIDNGVPKNMSYTIPIKIRLE